MPICSPQCTKALNILHVVFAFIAVFLMFFGAGAATGGEDGTDTEDEGERMKNFAWNQLQLKTTSSYRGASISDAGVYVGFNQVCAYGCSSGQCGGSCTEWADENYDNVKDFCDNDGQRQQTEDAINGVLASVGGSSGAGDDYTDKICGCFHMQFMVPVFLMLAATLMLADGIIVSVRACCSDGKCLAISQLVISILAAVFSMVAIMAYGAGCNLIDEPDAFLAWTALTWPAAVGPQAALVAAGQAEVEGVWGSGMWMSLFGALLATACAIFSCFTVTCQGECCGASASSTSRAPVQPSPAQGVPMQAAQVQAPPVANFDPITGERLAKFDPMTGQPLA